jgi:glycosyltransferase involved in cell wall biosynthesis
MTFTVVIATKNEEARIAAVIEPFLGRAEILVVDNFSTDQTLEILSKIGVSFVSMHHPGYLDRAWYESVFKYVKTEYILLSFCGHSHPPKLIDLYCEISANRSFAAVINCYQVYCYGRPANGWYTPSMYHREGIKFFSKKYLNLEGTSIHKEIKINCSESEIKMVPKSIDYLVSIFRDDNVLSNNEKHDRYCLHDSESRYQGGERTNAIKILASLIWHFFLAYFARGSYLQGVPGLASAYWITTYLVNTQFMIWEKQMGYDKAAIKSLHLKLRQEKN